VFQNSSWEYRKDSTALLSKRATVHLLQAETDRCRFKTRAHSFGLNHLCPVNGQEHDRFPSECG
jgi:hypothetical protein